jgi:hypothetical protein
MGLLSKEVDGMFMVLMGHINMITQVIVTDVMVCYLWFSSRHVRVDISLPPTCQDLGTFRLIGETSL